MTRGHTGLLLMGAWALAAREGAGEHRIPEPQPRQMSAAWRSAPHPSPKTKGAPSREGRGGGLIINSAGGKVKPPARSGAPSPIIMPARLSSPRAHAASLLLYFGLLFSLLCFLCEGKGAEGSKHPPPAPLSVSPFRKTPKAIICLRISFETATRKTSDCSLASVSDSSHPFMWLSLEPRPRLFCGRDLWEPRQFPSRCDVAKD